jgi:uncharacterized membrane protein
MKKLIERFGEWCLDSAPYELLIIVMGLLVIIFFVQIGIHNGRKMERSEAINRAPWVSVDR